ncbi:MAG: FecR domain-containing protein [Burkholderiales bacterium]|nr:FecR domain-containing protein [Burkholderiales bacterium]
MARTLGTCCMLLALSFSSIASALPKPGLGEASAPNSVCQGGYVHEITGLVSIQRAGTKAIPAKVGDVFEKDTTFRTGPDEEAILKFADGQTVALGPDSALRIVRYCYLANNLEQSGTSMELIKGQMRVVAGLIGVSSPRNLHIAVGASMVRIQKTGGADFIVAVNPDPRESGYAVVQSGEISVRTPYGPILRIAAGQYVPWQPGRAPPRPIPFAASPAVVQASLAELLACVLPSNSPVTVASAALTAGVLAAASQVELAANDNTRLAGYVQAVTNSVAMQTRSGSSATASVGSTFEAGTSFDTGSDGRAVLQLADGQVLVLGPGSVLNIGQYQFDPAKVKASKMTVELVNGAMRFITGSIQTENRDGISISAGASIIDILNAGPADFTVVVDTRNQEVGVARVALGEISVHTPYGPIDRIKADQSNLWGPGKAPAVPVASALELIQAAVALQISGLPDTDPVAVASAAAAAGAIAQANQAQAAASADQNNARLAAEAKAAAELADQAAREAAAADEAVAAKIIAAELEALPPTAAGPALGQATAAAPPASSIPAVPVVTPGAGGGGAPVCTGSPC